MPETQGHEGTEGEVTIEHHHRHQQQRQDDRMEGCQCSTDSCDSDLDDVEENCEEFFQTDCEMDPLKEKNCYSSLVDRDRHEKFIRDAVDIILKKAIFEVSFRN